MPYFFQFSKNGRRLNSLPAKERKKYSKPNGSTMNRICAVFEPVERSHINLNYANVPPFNWQMMLTSNQETYYADAVLLFCQMDDSTLPAVKDVMTTETEQEFKTGILYNLISKEITSEIEKRFGSLEVAYPSIVKYLFAGANANKMAHKQMFWRVFGDIACNALIQNMQTYTVCEKCGMKIPSWSKVHTCPKNAVGFFECCDCGSWCERVNSRQFRCSSCQEEYRRIQNNIINKMKYQRHKAEEAA